MGRKKNMGDKRERGTTKNFRCQLKWKDKEEGERGTTKNFRCQLKWKDKEEGERGTNINGELN